MFEYLKSIISLFIFQYFYKPFYKLVFSFEGIEEIYSRKDRLAVVIKDETIAKRIYPILKNMVERDIAISFFGVKLFKIEDFVLDKQDRVKIFYAKIQHNHDKNWSDYTITEKLSRLVSFVNSMQEEGYYLDASCFDNERCWNVSALISFFKTDSNLEQTSKGCLLECVHYVLSEGEDLKTFYKRIVEKSKIYKETDFPYNLPLIKICYYYYQNGEVKGDIFEALRQWNGRYDEYLVVNSTDLSAILSVVEETEEYTLYAENIKIYKYMPSGFETFLKEVNEMQNGGYLEKVLEKEKIDIVDFTGHIIGYKILEREKISEYHKLSELASFTKQSDIFNFIRCLMDFVSKDIPNSSYDFEKGQKYFDINDVLVWFDGERVKIKVDNYLAFFYFINSKEEIKKRIVEVFFKLYIDFLTKKYGEKHTRKEFLQLPEVKYLRPILAKELIHFALNKPFKNDEALEELYGFLDYHSITDAGDFYDGRMKYSPTKVPAIFDYEAKAKYGINIKPGFEGILPDGRRIVCFKRSMDDSGVKRFVENSLNDITRAIGNIEDENVSIIKISEIIYSRRISTSKKYLITGIITTPVAGRLLTKQEVLSLNNKQLFLLAGCLLSKFAGNSISLDCIWRDDNNHFVIDIFQDSFNVIKGESNLSQVDYIEKFIEGLREAGYNPYALLENISPGLAFAYHNMFNQRDLKEYFVNIANGMNAYCQEHGIYYSEYETGSCPICEKTKYFAQKDWLENAYKFMEDEVAVHYTMDTKTSSIALKVYKNMIGNVREIEENIDEIILSKLQEKESDCIQGCFKPIKKVIDVDGKCIGYIYDSMDVDARRLAENITTGLIDLKSSQLKNLPKLKSVIRLIIQVQDLMAKGMYFVQNPFQYVFLSKEHKKQVQILNIEFLGKGENRKDTIKWTFEYVREVLETDDSIQVDLSGCSQDLSLLLERLQALEKKMTKYCPIHKNYYTDDNWVCPLCIKKEVIGDTVIEEIDPDTFTKRNTINEGGESYIYSYGKKFVAKIFKKEEINSELKSVIIARVLQRKKALEEQNKQNQKYKYIIPQIILLDNKSHQLMGYAMEQVKEGKPISILRDTQQIEKFGFNRKDILEILITIGKGIEALHSEANIYIGDLNGRNILFDANKNVYFLEFDSVGIDEFVPLFCTDGYIDPMSKKNQNIGPKDDWYSFAIQAFYYLTFTHPFNGIYYENVNGRKVLLEITDKMERRISLLGNHGMKPPYVAKPWDWMTSNLKNAFLNIFEGDNRDSIVPYLVEQYEKLYGGDSEQDSEKSFRVNSKFIASKEKIFEENVVKIINPDIAVCRTEDEEYIAVWVHKDKEKKQYNFPLDKGETVQDVLVSENKKFLVIIFADRFEVFLLAEKRKIYSEEVNNMKNFVIKDQILYFIGSNHEGKSCIFSRQFFEYRDEIKCKKINSVSDQEIKCFWIKNSNSKFIMVKQSEDGKETIYYNGEKLCEIEGNENNSDCKIFYDNASKCWIILNSQKNGIFINAASQKIYRIALPDEVKDAKLGNMFFYNKRMYVPSEDCLYIVTINDDGQCTIKKMECHKIMASDSKVCSINSDGFSVITNNKFYVVHKV